jgi:putative cofactor-binding repeat protein
MNRPFANTVLLILAFAFVLVGSAAAAQPLKVCPSGCPYTTIQSAVGAAHEGDTIQIAAGTYPGASINKSVKLLGSGANETAIGRLTVGIGVSVTVSDVTVSGSTNSGVFNQGELTIKNSTVSGNRSTGVGGGIYNHYTGVLLLQSVKVTGNDAVSGAGIYNLNEITLQSSEISNNVASLYGGGIWNHGTTTLKDSAVDGNTAYDSGGLYNVAGLITATHSSVTNNSVTFGGANILNGGSGTMALRDTTVSGNVAITNGGGIYNFGDLTITHSTITGNTARHGGGVFNSGALVLSHSTVSANAASSNGGGIYNLGGAVTLNGCTVTANIAGSRGGGIYSFGGDIIVLSSTVTANTPDDIYP